NDRTFKVWDLPSGAQVASKSAHQAVVRSVVFLADGRTLVTASEDSTVKLWDTATWKEQLVLPRQVGPVRSLALSPDGKILATMAAGDGRGRRGEITLWDAGTDDVRSVLKSKSSCSWTIAFSPDGKTVAGTCSNGLIRLWDIATAAERLSLKCDAAPRGLAFSPDGRYLAAGQTASGVVVWNSI